MNIYEYETVRNKVIDQIDVDGLVDMEQAKLTVEEKLLNILDQHAYVLTKKKVDVLIKTLYDDIFGLGAIQDLLDDNTVNDILINGTSSLYIEKQGKLVRQENTFRNNEQIMRIAQRIVTPIGRRIDESSPMVDGRLSDGSRVNIIVPPIALDGCVISIRKFRAEKLGLLELIEFGSMSPEMAYYLSIMVRCKANIIISGGTGSGKTTLLNAISNEIDDGDRIVTIEDAAELQIQKGHVVRLESRSEGLEGGGQVSIHDLVINSLRMRPDRIIIGECRGEEAFEMLQAMNTGHDGSFSTIHANTPKDALTRLESMLSMGKPNIPTRALKGQISQAVDIIVQCSRLSNGERKITSITEIGSISEDIIQSQEVFSLVRDNVDNRIVYRHEQMVSNSLLQPKAEFVGLGSELKGLFCEH